MDMRILYSCNIRAKRRTATIRELKARIRELEDEIRKLSQASRKAVRT